MANSLEHFTFADIQTNSQCILENDILFEADGIMNIILQTPFSAGYADIGRKQIYSKNFDYLKTNGFRVWQINEGSQVFTIIVAWDVTDFEPIYLKYAIKHKVQESNFRELINSM